ncbi:MAG TPA: EcsC family protein [Rhodanobacteraceae bacterium]|nr:EcsC family protein [Rhodanobacteraceae bacterium]
MTRSLPAAADAPSHRIAQQILDFLSDIPASHELPSEHPRARAEAIAAAARRKAFLASSSLALPPGPLGWLTVLPELVAIWKIQAKMVSDIAAACGQHAAMSREQMLYCLFRHAASQAVRDLVVRAGQRVIVQAATTSAIRRVAERIGIKLSERALGSSLARMVPVAGALGVGAYAWYDTRQVARTAIAMFSREVEFIPAPRSTEVPAQRVERDRAQDAREAGL